MSEDNLNYDGSHPEADIEDELPVSREQLAHLVNHVDELTSESPKEHVAEECYLRTIPLGPDEILELRRYSKNAMEEHGSPRAAISIISGAAGQRVVSDIGIDQENGDFKASVYHGALDRLSDERVSCVVNEAAPLSIEALKKTIETWDAEKEIGLQTLSYKRANELLGLLDSLNQALRKNGEETLASTDQIDKIYNLADSKLNPLEWKNDQYYALEDGLRYARITVSTLFTNNGPTDPEGNKYEFEIWINDIEGQADKPATIYYINPGYIEKELWAPYSLNNQGMLDAEVKGEGLVDLINKEFERRKNALKNWGAERAIGVHHVSQDDAERLLNDLHRGKESYWTEIFESE